MSNGGAQRKIFGPFFDSAGAIYRGIRVKVYTTGTTNAKTYWTDEAKTAAVATGNLDDSDGDGIVTAFFDGDYRFQVKQSDLTSDLDDPIDWDTTKVTSDSSTMWEGNVGTSYPTANSTNIFQQFVKADSVSSPATVEIGMNFGAAFVPITSTYTDNLSDAITAIGSTATDLVLTSDYTMVGNLEINANTTLNIPNGAVIATGINTLTISGNLQAGMYTIFDTSGGGTVVLGASSATHVFPQWWGATADGTTDDSVAMRSAIAATGQNKMLFPSGVYLVSKDGANDYAILFSGVDIEGSTTSTNVNPTGSVIKLADAQDCDIAWVKGTHNSIRNMAFQGNRDNQTLTTLSGLRVSDAYNCTIDHVHISGVSGIGFEAKSTIADGPNACLGSNIFVYDCIKGFEFDVNSNNNHWDNIGCQEIKDDGTVSGIAGSVAEYGFIIKCNENVFTSLYAEGIGTNAGSANRAVLYLNQARGNLIDGCRVVTHNCEYGLYTDANGANNNILRGLRGFTAVSVGTNTANNYNTGGILLTAQSTNNRIYEIDDTWVPGTAGVYSDAQGYNYVMWEGEWLHQYNRTTDLTISTDRNGTLFTNLGAVTEITYTLPAATVGQVYTFVHVANTDIVIAMNGTDLIRGGVAGASYGIDNVGESLKLRCVEDGIWDIVGGNRTGSKVLTSVGPTDNVNVTGLTALEIGAGSNAVTIGGFVGGSQGQVLHVVVVAPGAGNAVTLEHNEGTGNQDIFLTAGADDSIAANTYGGWTLYCTGSTWVEVRP